MLESHNLNVGVQVLHLDENNNIIKKYNYISNYIDTSSNIEVIVRLDNNIIHNEKYPFRSYVNNLLAWTRKWLFYNNETFPISEMELLDVLGNKITSWFISTTSGGYQFLGRYGETFNGIVVGTSSVEHNIKTFNLYGKIEHGNATDLLGYQAQAYLGLNYISSSYYNVISRSFINSSSAPINIREIGIIGNYSAFDLNLNTNAFLICRDIKDYAGNYINITLPTASIVTINYNLFFPNTNHLTKQYAQLYQSCATNANVTVKTVSGGTLTVNAAAGNWSHTIINSTTAHNENYGILVGSASSPFDLNDYALYGQILPGTSTNNLYHFPHYVSPIVSESNSGSYSSFYIERLITNYTTNTFNINEVGIYTYNTTLNNRFLLARTVISTISLIPSQSIMVRYLFFMTSSI